MRLTTYAAVAAATALTLSACGNSAATSTGAAGGGGGGGSDQTVTIGLMTPKSGPYAQLGTYFDQGMQLYVEQHGNKLGGKNVKLVEADEGAGPQEALPNIRKMLQQDQAVAVAGVINSGVAAAAIPTLTNAKVPLLTSANDFEVKFDHWWNIGWGNFATTSAMAEYIAAEAKKDDGSVYLLGSDYTGGHGVVGQMRKALEEKGIKIAGETYTPYGTTKDYQPYLSKVKSSGAKHVFAFYAGAEAIQFVKQYKEFGLDKQAKLDSNFAITEGVLEAEGPAAVGIASVSNYTPDLDNPTNKKFVADYQQKYGQRPNTYSEAGYGAMAALDKALGTIQGQVTGEAIQKALPTMGEVTSARGTWKFENNGPTQKFYIRQVKNEGGQLTQPVIVESGTYATRGQKVS